MITFRMVWESAVNNLLGRNYYDEVFLKKVDRNRNYLCGGCVLCLSFDLDEESDYDNLPWLLDLLKKYRVKGSFAVIGRDVVKNPGLFAMILDGGHELINHTMTHPDSGFKDLPEHELIREIIDCHNVVSEALGYEMRGFRVPHFGFQFTPRIYLLLDAMGYVYSSSTVAVRTRNAGYPYVVDDVLELPLSVCPRHPFCIFDTSHAFRSRTVKHKDFVNDFKELLKISLEHKMFLNIYADPQDLKKFDFEAVLGVIQNHRNSGFLRVLTMKEYANEVKR